MDVTIAESGPCRRTVNIVVPADKVRAHIDEVFKAASRQVQLKGFRPGKVPRKVLEAKFGDQILSEAKESLINRSFEDALRERKLIPLGRPDLEGIDESPLDSSTALEFKVHFDVRPEFAINEVKGLEVKRGDEEVTDDDVKAALAQLAAEHRTLDKVDEPVADGDFVRLDIFFKDEDGKVVHERKGAQLNVNIPLAGTDAEAFASKLRGTEVGAQLTLDIDYPETFEKEAVRGKKGAVDLELLEVLRVTPAPIDDDLAKKFDFESLEQLREQLTERLAHEKQRMNRARQEEDLIAQIVNENPFALPESMVEDQAEHSLQNFARRLEQNGLPKEEIEQRVESAKEDARQDAERRVRTFFLLDAIAKKEKIFVTESDVDVELRNIAAQNGVSVNDVRDHYESHKLLPDLRLGLMERKVRDFLREHAKLTD